MTKKFIQLRHSEYFTALHEIAGYKKMDLTCLEFDLTEDKEGENHYFWLDFYNLKASNTFDFLAEDANEESKKLLVALNQGDIDFFISAAYFSAEHVCYEPDRFKEATIFQQRSNANVSYIHVALNETLPLVPERIIEWLTKLSKPLFGEQFDFEIGTIPSKEIIEKEYLEEIEKNHKAYFLGRNEEFLLKICNSGWSEFCLGEFSTEVSGVTNFPLDCANGFIKALEGELPVSIGFDEEGTELTLVLDYYNRISLLSYDDEEVKVYQYKATHRNLANIFLNDMARDFEGYTNDEYYFNFNKFNEETYRKELFDKLTELRLLVKNCRD